MTLYSLPMPLSSLSTIVIFFFLVRLIPSATPLTFNFPNISDQQSEIILANNASNFSSSQGLQLTPTDVDSIRQQRAGRASYIEPFHLWDSASGELADFTTSFSFVIDSFGSSVYGDGIAFFLAENNSVITPGGAFGLPIDPNTIVPTARFVAVEFDTFWNSGWDPLNSANMSIGDHVGIDISSLHSVAYEKWWSRIPSGRNGLISASLPQQEQISRKITSSHGVSAVPSCRLMSTWDRRKPERDLGSDVCMCISCWLPMKLDSGSHPRFLFFIDIFVIEKYKQLI